MPIPADILAVVRPKNTIVIDYGDGKYGVRERIGCKYEVTSDGKKRRIPIDGKIIGHIVNNEFIYKTDSPKLQELGRVDIKDWANVFICDMQNKDLLSLLCNFYHKSDAIWIYCEAILRTCYSGVRDYELKHRYEESFLSEFYPGVAFSKDTVCEKTRLLGRQRNTIYAVMNSRIQGLSETDMLIIDGSLKEDNSDEICIAEVSRKTAKTGTKHHTMMYAYSLEKMEPVAHKNFPGNMVDSRSIKDFINTFTVIKGLLVADKGFKPEAMIEAIRGHEHLGYLVPLERNRAIIDQYNMYQMDTVICVDNQHIACRKAQLVDENNQTLSTWLYAYRDQTIAAEEDELYLQQHQDFLDIRDYEEKKKSFGTIVFQSNYDLDLNSVYDIYSKRWQIETLFRFHKTTLDEDDTRMHSEHSAVGSDFIDFLSTVMGSRMLKFFRTHDKFKKMTYKSAMNELRRCRKVRIGSNNAWELERMTVKRTLLIASTGIISLSKEMLETLGIKNDPEFSGTQKKTGKRGRPKGSKDSKPRKRKNSTKKSV